MSTNKEKPLVAFDLDHTLMRVNSSFSFGCFLYKHRFISLLDLSLCIFYYVIHKNGALSMQALHHRVFNRFFKKMSYRKIKEFLAPFIAQSVPSLMNHRVWSLFKEAKAQGKRVAILSSSPDFLVEAIGEHLGADFSVGTHYSVDKAGLFCAISHIFDGQAKAEWIRSHPGDITAYSDSHLDIPFLEVAAKAIAVNPDRKLTAACQRRGWEIIYTERCCGINYHRATENTEKIGEN